MSSLPAGTPIIIFCLDNSCFLAATGEGGLAPISKCVPEDDGYHVNGALVVAPECALQITLDLLKRLVMELSEYQIFIITPITRYISGPCCDAAGHVSNSGDPDFLSSILSGLTKLKFLLSKKLAPATVLDGIELISGSGCGRERTEQILRTSWVDPVHPKQHIYSKMALNLIEKVAASISTPTSQKRSRSESSEETSSSRGRQDRSVRGGGGGSRGGQQAIPPNSSNTAYTAPGSSRSARGFQHSNNYTWTPPRGRGFFPGSHGRGDARGRGHASERGRGNPPRGGQPRGGWRRPWSRW